MINTNGLDLSYSSDGSFSFPDIVLADSEDCLIFGQSEVGKTTLLMPLAEILQPDSGFVQIGEIPALQVYRVRISEVLLDS